MIAVFIIISYILFEEKENGLFAIIRTTPKGSLATILAKASNVYHNRNCYFGFN